MVKLRLTSWDKDYAHKTMFGEEQNKTSPQDNLEIYFETSDLDDMWAKIKKSESNVLHEIRTQPWQQRVFRVYDPDNFIVEIAESMTEVIKRLQQSNISIDEIVKKTFMPREVVESILNG